MAKMYPKSISEYMPTDSERIVYQELKNQLPDSTKKYRTFSHNLQFMQNFSVFTGNVSILL